MRNYPKIIRNLHIGKSFDKIADDFDKYGLIIKGTIDETGKKVIFQKSNDEVYDVNNFDHNAYNYLPKHQSEQIKMLNNRLVPRLCKKEIHNITLLGLFSLISAGLVTTFPVLASLYAILAVYQATELYKNQKLYKLVDLDNWFSENLDRVKSELKVGTPLYAKLKPKSKEILKRPNIAGSITINNIDEFPLKDLKLIRRSIRQEMEQEELERKKTWEKIKK